MLLDPSPSAVQAQQRLILLNWWFDQRVINPFAIAALCSIVFRYPHKINHLL